MASARVSLPRVRFGRIMANRFRLSGVVAAVAAVLLLPTPMAVAQFLPAPGKASPAAPPPSGGFLDEPGPPPGEVGAPRRRLVIPAEGLRRPQAPAKRAARGSPLAKRPPATPPGL